MRRRGPSVGGWVNHSSTLRYLVVPAPSTIVCLPSSLAPTFDDVLDVAPARVEDVGRQLGLVGGVDLDAEARRGGLQLDLADALELAEVDRVADGDLLRSLGSTYHEVVVSPSSARVVSPLAFTRPYGS